MQSISDNVPSPESRWHYAVALLSGVIIAGLFLVAAIPSINHFADSDSSRFVEAARNFLQGKGLLVSAHAARLPMPTEPLSLWPPGYPIMISLGSRILGVDALWIAPRISWACWILLPVAILFALRPFLRDLTIHAIGVMAMLAPGTIHTAHRALSDMPFLLLTTLSLGLLFRGTLARPDCRLVFLSGLIGAAAYSVRNIGLALFGAVLVSVAIFSLCSPARRGDALRMAGCWLAGAAIILVPLGLRNILTFGDLQPYSMAPSTIGLTANIRYYLIALLDDIAGRPEIDHALFWNNKAFLAVLVIALAGLFLLRKFLARRWSALSSLNRQVLIILLCNVLLGSAIVILARTRYQWGELISPRHLQQYDWMIFAMLALLLEPLLRKSKTALSIACAIFVTLVGLRSAYAVKAINESRTLHRAAAVNFDITLLSPKPSLDDNALMQIVAARDDNLMRAIRNLPAGTLLLSNRYEVLRNETGRPVTKLLISANCTIQPDITDSLTGTSAAILFFPTVELVHSRCWQRLYELSQSRAILHLDRPYLASLTWEQAKEFRPRHVSPRTKQDARPDIDE